MRHSRGHFANGKPLLIAGLEERYTCETSKAVPAQWQRFVPYLGNISRQVGRATFGVSCNGDDEGNFDYIAGVEVTDFSDLPAAFSRVRIGPRKYAVFSHREHISTIRRTVNTIWSKWLPESGHEVADAPNFERFGEDFDPKTGLGGFEIWIPIKATRLAMGAAGMSLPQSVTRAADDTANSNKGGLAVDYRTAKDLIALLQARQVTAVELL